MIARMPTPHKRRLPLTMLLLCSMTSQAVSSNPALYWAVQTSGPEPSRIDRAHIDGSGVETILTTGISAPRDIVLDPGSGTLFWSDVNANRIGRANLDGSEPRIIWTSDGPAGLAFDANGGQLYWTDFIFNKISRTNLATATTEILITTGLSNPMGIDLDLQSGRMYWADAGTGKIQRANLDGSDVEDLVTGLSNPRDVVLDLNQGRMYWVDLADAAVYSSDLEGSDVQLLVTTTFSPNYLALDPIAGEIYFSDGSGVSRISRVDPGGAEFQPDVVLSISGGTIFGIGVLPEPSTVILVALGSLLAMMRRGERVRLAQ